MLLLLLEVILKQRVLQTVKSTHVVATEAVCYLVKQQQQRHSLRELRALRAAREKILFCAFLSPVLSSLFAKQSTGTVIQ